MIREGLRVVNQAALLLAVGVGCSAPQRWDDSRPLATEIEARITLVDPAPVQGGALRVRLDIRNRSGELYVYDAQQVDVNSSFDVRNPEGRQALYTYGPYSTFGSQEYLLPGQTTTLIQGLNLAEQYSIDRPGSYTVQYQGRGLFIAPNRLLRRGLDGFPDLFLSSMRVLSNVLAVEVADRISR